MMDHAILQREFKKRIDKNFADFKADWLCSTPEELIMDSDQIAATIFVHDQCIDMINDQQMEYFLNYDNPLEILRDYLLSEMTPTYLDVKTAINEGRTPIILSNLTFHVRILAEMLHPHATHVVSLVGADSAKEKRMAMEKLDKIAASESLVIVATGKYIGEGFDYPRLDTLFLALPISWKGNIAQYAGRLHRDFAGKNEVRIYDYIDIRIPLCDSMYRK